MPTNLYLIRKQQLASVFEDTMAQIKQSEEWMIAIDYSIHNQQFIPESAIMSISNVPKADKPANIIVSRLRSFEAAAQYIGKRTAVLNFASATKCPQDQSIDIISNGGSKYLFCSLLMQSK